LFLFLLTIFIFFAASDEVKKGKICEAMRLALDLPQGTVLEYKEHNASLRDNSSFRNTNVYRPPGMRQGGSPGPGSSGVGPIGSGTNSSPGGYQTSGKGRNRANDRGMYGGREDKKQTSSKGSKMSVWRPEKNVQPEIPVFHTSAAETDDATFGPESEGPPLDLWGGQQGQFMNE
jgi:hypothetical protein